MVGRTRGAGSANTFLTLGASIWQLRRDWSASYLSGYWAMQPRVHQAFYTVKTKCWNVCKNDRSTPEQRQARLQCVTDKCYLPSQAADRERAQAAGVQYEQMQTPLLMRAAYGTFEPRFVVMLHNPVDRRALVPVKLHQVHLALVLPCDAAFCTNDSAQCSQDERICCAADCIRLSGPMATTGTAMEGRPPKGFLNFVREQVSGFHNCTVAGHTPFTCALYLESLSQHLEDTFHCDQLMRGMYSIWLHVWFEFFPRRSFLTLRTEDYFANPRRALRQVFAHLQLREPTESEWHDILIAAEIRSAATGKEMLPEALDMANTFYKPFNDDLIKLLGNARWSWRQL
jgi:hypothetical protein